MNGERQKNPDEIGALWQRESGGGKLYLTGQITIDGKETRIVCFRVVSNHPKAPLWRILISKPYEKDRQAEERSDDSGDDYSQGSDR